MLVSEGSRFRQVARDVWAYFDRLLVITVIVTASAGDTAWQAAAAAEAMMIRVMFTELDGEMATHSLLFDARKSVTSQAIQAVYDRTFFS